MDQERVLCAAIWVQTGVKYSQQPVNIENGFVISGHRHCSCLEVLGFTEIEYKNKSTQGFLTSKNRFLTREEARKLVLRTGQLKETRLVGELYSEDLY